jgi:DNA-binding transcriptional ArsR family regulator
MTQAEAQQEEDTAASVRLLADLRQVFQAAGAEALYTSTILEALHRLEDGPWADWYGYPLTTRDLARLLRPYQVESRNIREHGTGAPRKGYVRADLQDAWARYVPLHPLHALQPSEPAGQPGNGRVADLLSPSATSATGSSDVADVAASPNPSATGLTCDVAHVADVAAPPVSNGNGWRYDQPMTPCTACGTGTTNRAPSGRPLHLACAANTTTEGPHHG